MRSVIAHLLVLPAANVIRILYYDNDKWAFI